MSMIRIRAGDRVLSYNEETGEQGYKEVVRLFRNETTEWYHIRVNGEEIVCTGERPFYIIGKGYVAAKELKESDKVLQSDGTLLEMGTEFSVLILSHLLVLICLSRHIVIWKFWVAMEDD